MYLLRKRKSFSYEQAFCKGAKNECFTGINFQTNLKPA